MLVNRVLIIGLGRNSSLSLKNIAALAIFEAYGTSSFVIFQRAEQILERRNL